MDSRLERDRGTQLRPDREVARGDGRVGEPSGAADRSVDEPLTEWADRYSVEAGRQLSADDTVAGTQHASSRGSASDRADVSKEPAATSDVPEPDESRGAEAGEAVREQVADQLSHLPEKLRQQMANDPVFSRAGWGREDNGAWDEDLEDQPLAPDGSDPNGRSPDPVEQPLTKPAEEASTSSGRRDRVDDPSSVTEPDRTVAAGQDRRADPDNDNSYASDDGLTEATESERRADGGESAAADSYVGDDASTESAGIESEPDRPVDASDAPEHEFVEDADPEDMATYRRIRETDDVDAVAENSGFPRDVVEVAKDNLFMRTHDVAVRPGVIRHGYFTPDAVMGDLWETAASGGELTGEQQTMLWSLLAHEYVEAKLMEAGVPYKSADVDAFNEYGVAKVTSEHPSAHITAPRSLQEHKVDLLAHWEKLDISRDGLRVAEDLSNLDEVVRLAKEGLGL
ncbi:hypothetical protein [Kribbella sp.]|uniref:hypothetical protein n=1 Tax=Kribbella sp. TaxID=1871183 RepID=UPI002D2913AD|nr:hypothetical protein [Kribbella sp.]HZX07571.1 hypothetical protein [Kribbella sp.]